MRNPIDFKLSDSDIDKIIEEKLRIKALNRKEAVGTETKVSQETTQDIPESSHKTFTLTDKQKRYLTENTHKSKDLYTELKELLKKPPDKLKNLNKQLNNVISDLITAVSLEESNYYFEFPIDPDLISHTVNELLNVQGKVQAKPKRLNKEHEKISTFVFELLSSHWQRVGEFLSSTTQQ